MIHHVNQSPELVTAEDFASLNASLGTGRAVRGLDYVRCVELPLVYNALALEPGMKLLDAGARTSIFPVMVAARNPVEVHAVDLDPEVERLRETTDHIPLLGTLVVRQADLRSLPYENDTFDRVTVISVIEHVPGTGDTEGIRDLARVLKPGGRLVLTVPFGRTARDFFLNEKVYSEDFRGEPVFFQRHYTPETLRTRLLEPSGLRELRRAYFGETGFPFFNRFLVLPGWLKPVKAAYAWATPRLARRFMGIYDTPDRFTLPSPPMITANGAFVVLEKER